MSFLSLIIPQSYINNAKIKIHALFIADIFTLIKEDNEIKYADQNMISSQQIYGCIYLHHSAIQFM